ncbi:hypothetical protein [Peterkaempfera sp. SMS 1(5)a]|uniref:hypothetical protein n=1 Tax=Peterkaempfera podocarpi TaxID=3232308 RepID=UPI0036705C7B
MNHLRVFALAAAPTALLIGLAAPATAVNASGAKAVCAAPAAHQVLTAKQGLQVVKNCAARQAQSKSWHWMGNYGSVYDVATVANGAGVGAGELITLPNASGGGLLPTFMYY